MSAHPIKTDNSWIPAHWPNIQTRNSVLTIGVTVACCISKIPQIPMLRLHAPFRIFSSVQALHQRKDYKVIMDVLGLVALFFPYGQFISIGLDSASEIINFYDQPPSDQLSESRALVEYQNKQEWKDIGKVLEGIWINLKNIFSINSSKPRTNFRSTGRIDPSVLENAYYILGIENNKSLEAVQERYEKTMKNLQKIKKNLPEMYLEDMQLSIDETEMAYKTITNSLIFKACKILGLQERECSQFLNTKETKTATLRLLNEKYTNIIFYYEKKIDSIPLVLFKRMLVSVESATQAYKVLTKIFFPEFSLDDMSNINLEVEDVSAVSVLDVQKFAVVKQAQFKNWPKNSSKAENSSALDVKDFSHIVDLEYLDPKSLDDAYNILGIKKNDVKNSEFLESETKRIDACLRENSDVLSSFLMDDIKVILNYIKASYETIKNYQN